MKPISRFSLAIWISGALALFATAARSDVIMDWNAKADAIARRKAASERRRTPADRRCSTSRCSRRSTPSTGAMRLTSSTSARTGPHQGKPPRPPRPMTCCWRCIRTRRPTSMLRSPASLAGIAENEAKSKGIELGKQAAAGIIALRANDGSNTPEDYRPATTAGVYVPTTIPIESTSSKIKPFAMTSASQFRAAPPPALTSETWTRDLNEIREIGSNTSAKRSAEQTTIARFWFFTGPRTYNTIVRQIASNRKMDLVDCARLYALTSIAGADAFIAVFEAKYAYNFWRPVTAIRNADLTSNPGDPARGIMAAAGHDADAPGISVRALYHRQRRFHGAAARRGQRDRRDHADEPDGCRRYTQVDAAAGLQRRGFQRAHLCRLPLPLLHRSRQGHGKEDR